MINEGSRTRKEDEGSKEAIEIQRRNKTYQRNHSDEMKRGHREGQRGGLSQGREGMQRCTKVIV